MNDVYAPPKSDVHLPETPGTGIIDTSSTFSPRGRFTRLSYLAWSFVMYFVLIAIVAVAGLIASSAADFIMIPLTLIFSGILWIYSIRRLHDMNLSGWWSLLNLVPVANAVFGIVLMAYPGNKETNRFAPLRPTKGWEKIAAILSLILIMVALVLVVIFFAIGPEKFGL